MFLAGAAIASNLVTHRIPAGLRAQAAYQDPACALVQLAYDQPNNRRPPRPGRMAQQPSGAVPLLAGTLYNAKDLAAMLGADPSCPAAMLIGEALDRWGAEPALSRLNGDYALAHWSPAEQTLLLASDPMGQRSLYYAETSDGFVAAGQASWLLAFPSVSIEPDLDSLAMRLVRLEHRIGNSTPWRHIKRLLPGHCLRWQNGAIRIFSFWSPIPRRTLHLKRDEDYVAAAREQMERAVKLRLPKQQAVLCLLSAGLDSPGMAAMAAMAHDSVVHTLTVRSEPTASQAGLDARHFVDEWERLQPFFQMCPSLVPHLAEAVQPDLTAERPGGLLQSREWPIKGMFQPAWLLPALDKAARNLGISTVFIGSGGNGTLSYAGHFVVADQLRSWRWQDAWRNKGKPDDSSALARLRLIWAQMVHPLMPAAARAVVNRLRGRSDDWWREWSVVRPEIGERLAPGHPGYPPRLTRSQDLDMHIHLIERFRHNHAQFGHLTQSPLWCMRDPYADRELVEFCLALPRDQFRSGGVYKWLARRVFSGLVPGRILSERRVGLQHGEWFDWMTARREWIAAELDRIESSALACSILDTKRMRAFLDDWPANADAATRFPYSHRIRKGLGEGLRIGQFILMQEGRNE